MANAISDDNYFQTKQARRDQDGAVIIENRNILTKGVKKGHTDKVLFSAPSYVSKDDPYQDSSKF